MPYKYVGCCVDLDGEAISEMQESAIDITYRTFLKNIGTENYRLLCDKLGYALNRSEGLALYEDWHVSYHRSKHLGKRCYYLKHSAIEYVFEEVEA